MPLLTLTDISLAYGHHRLLEHVDLQVEKGERICLLGRNGTGKSTLFRVISQQVAPDDGVVWHPETLRIASLQQEVPDSRQASVFDVVAAGLGETGRLLAAYQQALAGLDDSSQSSLDQLAELQHRIDVCDGWNMKQKVESVLSRLSLDPGLDLDSCSGGMRRRVMLASALVSDPDLLLLDEPTNHMDISNILWLEDYLKSYNGALMFITHDRTFLRNLATRIIELDRGKLTSFACDYQKYLERKEMMLAAEEKANQRFDKKLADGEKWIRQGIKARRTRNEGRVRALQAMREQRRARRDSPGQVNISLDEGQLSGKLVSDLRNVSFAYDDRPVVRNLTTRIMRGDRVGIIGPNGSGKTTLLRLLLGELEPSSGEVVLGTKLSMAYFDQHRSQLKLDRTVRENISDGADHVSVRGRSQHVIGYLRKFLFPPERVDSPVSSLSGGERNRLMLARLFTSPANMLVLDEPTNDLDVDTLELLEDLLIDYDGTLLLVSHDRSFLDNVVTSTLVFGEQGEVCECVGGYEDWLRQSAVTGNESGRSKLVHDLPERDRKSPDLEKKLTYREKTELESLPDRIEGIESELQVLELQISEATFYRQDSEAISATLGRIEQLRDALEKCYQRWEILDARN